MNFSLYHGIYCNKEQYIEKTMAETERGSEILSDKEHGPTLLRLK